VTAGDKWEVAILGTKSINGCFGADYYCYSASSGGGWTHSDPMGLEQESIYGFLTS
jgi:hypothetical protein